MILRKQIGNGQNFNSRFRYQHSVLFLSSATAVLAHCCPAIGQNLKLGRALHNDGLDGKRVALFHGAGKVVGRMYNVGHHVKLGANAVAGKLVHDSKTRVASTTNDSEVLVRIVPHAAAK